jgi:hypothetical protein
MMFLGNMAKDGGNLIMLRAEARGLIEEHNVDPSLVREFFGSEELIRSQPRACLWIEEDAVDKSVRNEAVKKILERVRHFRASSDAPSTRAHASTPTAVRLRLRQPE